MFSLSTNKLKNVVDNVFFETYNILNEHKGGEKMANERKENVYLEQSKKDSEELLEILKRIPDERKGEVLGIIKGFALCAEKAG